MKKIVLNILFCFSLFWLVLSCSRLELAPGDAVPAESAISDVGSARAATLGVYDYLQDFLMSTMGLHSLNGVYSDEVAQTGSDPARLEYDNFNIFPGNYVNEAVFAGFYNVINVANNVIEKVPKVDDPTLNLETANGFVAEARFLRAFCYWYLVNNYGNVPLVLQPTTETGEKLQVPNTPKAEVIAQMEEDLLYAEQHLRNPQGFRASSLAAQAMLARLYLQQGEYQKAFDKAQLIIDSGQFALETDYGNIFNGGTAEQIWYINFSVQELNGSFFWYLPAEKGGRREIAPAPELIAAFEPQDVRVTVSIDTIGNTVYGAKYMQSPAGVDPLYLIRYAEILLIAAEAAAEEEDWTKANEYYNLVRSRANLATKTLDASNYVDLILQERFVEMAMEGPQRFWDLKRRNKTAEVLGPFGYEEGCDDLWPYPQSDRDVNPNLNQNPCY